MKIKHIIVVLLTSFTITAHSQNPNFSRWSGTIRFGGGLYGTMFSYSMPMIVGILTAMKNTSDFNVHRWSDEQHTLWRFTNFGGDVLIPSWTMTASNASIDLLRGDDDNFLNDGANQYTYYIGYQFSWMDLFSRFGFFVGADYEWKNFMIHYPYPNVSHNKIHSVVPTIGLRYRLISTRKEIEGFPFNIVLEGGMSFVFNVKYENYDDYDIDALNNGFRSVLGIAITTSRYGSIHLRWTKDLYNLFNSEYHPTRGPLYNNEINNTFKCISIGWNLFI